MRLRCGDQLFDVELSEAQGRWQAVVDGQALELTLVRDGEGRFVVQHEGSTATLHLARVGSRLYAFWDGVAYRLTLAQEGVRQAARQDRAGTLEAPMPGRVSAVTVAVGQRVTKGEELLVVEAMKMENALRAPRAGVVLAVHASVGEMVAPGRVLVEIGDAAEGR
jgi:3-methylcrotonyl-CoA carboxylase alpha subunit